MIHVVGAGLAGLSAAVRLADEGCRVTVYEAARHAGGRCRSYHDPALGLVIDNGNHLLLSGNHAALDYVGRIGARAALAGPATASFSFADLKTGERWTIEPNAGRIGWWIADARRRVPGTKVGDYLGVLGLFRAGASATICEAIPCSGALHERLLHPLFLAGLNTHPQEASAALAAQLVRETLLAGGRAYRPLVAVDGLAAAFVDPALAHLAAGRHPVHFSARLRGLRFQHDVAESLDFGDNQITLGPDDRLILAVPPWVAQELLPDLGTPDEFRAIVNAHFRIAPPPGSPLLLGVLGGLSEWLFAFPDRLAVTISGADRLLDAPREALAAEIWAEVATLTGLAKELPRWQIVKERRATFAATPAQAAKRPPVRTRFRNVALAGDWTDTGLPATIEGAVRSGYQAAAHVGASMGRRAPAEARN